MLPAEIQVVERSRNYLWDTNLLDWVKATQSTAAGPSTDVNVLNFPASQAVTGPLTDTQLRAANVGVAGVGALLPASGSVSSAGNNTCVTPTAGKKLRVYYAAYNNPGGAVECAFRIGAAGALWLRNNLPTAGCVIAKDFGDFRYVEGAVNEALILNLSAGVSVIWNAFTIEV